MCPLSVTCLSNKCPCPSHGLSWFHLPCNRSQQKVATVIIDQATPSQLGKSLTAHKLSFLTFCTGFKKLCVKQPPISFTMKVLDENPEQGFLITVKALEYSPLVFHLVVGSLMALRRAPPHGATCFGVTRRRRDPSPSTRWHQPNIPKTQPSRRTGVGLSSPACLRP